MVWLNACNIFSSNIFMKINFLSWFDLRRLAVWKRQEWILECLDVCSRSRIYLVEIRDLFRSSRAKWNVCSLCSVFFFHPNYRKFKDLRHSHFCCTLINCCWFHFHSFSFQTNTTQSSLCRPFDVATSIMVESNTNIVRCCYRISR